jgi:hypothetical protein
MQLIHIKLLSAPSDFSVVEAIRMPFFMNVEPRTSNRGTDIAVRNEPHRLPVNALIWHAVSEDNDRDIFSQAWPSDGNL